MREEREVPKYKDKYKYRKPLPDDDGEREDEGGEEEKKKKKKKEREKKKKWEEYKRRSSQLQRDIDSSKARSFCQQYHQESGE